MKRLSILSKWRKNKKKWLKIMKKLSMVKGSFFGKNNIRLLKSAKLLNSTKMRCLKILNSLKTSLKLRVQRRKSFDNYQERWATWKVALMSYKSEWERWSSGRMTSQLKMKNTRKNPSLGNLMNLSFQWWRRLVMNISGKSKNIISILRKWESKYLNWKSPCRIKIMRTNN